MYKLKQNKIPIYSGALLHVLVWVILVCKLSFWCVHNKILLIAKPKPKKKNTNNNNKGKNKQKMRLKLESEHIVWTEVKVTQSCLTLCDRMICTVRGILQARILEWVAIPFCRRSSQPRDQTQVFHIAGRFFTSWATREVPGSK